LSAGIGVTPLLAMLYATAGDEQGSSRDVWWIHSARDKAHHAFAGTARSLVAALRHGHLFVIYSRPGRDDAPGVDYDVKGHLTLPLLKTDRCSPKRGFLSLRASAFSCRYANELEHLD
jgi:ferredoxin-NADP reductase